MTAVRDLLGRPLRDLRISVTDRCNFRCTYCMPREAFGPGHRYVPRDRLLSFDEIVSVAAAFTALGARKIRITGGEPLLRKGVVDLVGRIAAVPGVEDLTMSTNGALLAGKAAALAEAGLRRVTVSLDALDDPTFRAMSDVGLPAATVLEAIDAAAAAGLGPVKVNAVVRRGVNEHAVLELADRFRGTGHILRFIEYMDVGATNGWRLDDVATAEEILAAVHEAFPLEAVESNYPGEAAGRFRYVDGQGEIGVIASVTRPFCGSCTRARVSAEGVLYTCLFASSGADLRTAMRSGQDVVEVVAGVWASRGDRYSELRSAAAPRLAVPVEMSHIGG